MSGEQGKLDVWLDRLYARLGGRLVFAYMVWSWMSGLAVGLVAVVVYGRSGGLDTEQILIFAGLVTGVWVLHAAVGIYSVLRAARPVTEWLEQGRPAEDAEEVWAVAVDLPRLAVTRSAVVMTSAPVAVVFSYTLFADLDLADWVALLLTGYALVGLGVAAGVFMVQLAVRPILRDIATHLERPPEVSGISVRRKLFLGVPYLIAAMCGSAIGISSGPGDDPSAAFVHSLIPLAVVLSFAIPVALLLAYSTIQPLDDLMRATERLKRRDFSTRVPELSADEHGALARSFNEAMEGLAEREKLARENEELLAEVSTLLEEARASRARIVTASDAERRRVERNLHDGAQQRLVALALQLRMLEEGAETEQTRKLAAAAADELKGALAELRELARGLHPQVLTAGGLAPAIEQLAAQSPVPVGVDVPSERLPEEVESTAYFVASEALANVAKYSRAERAAVSGQRLNGRLVLAIADDGVGGAVAEPGSGLAGLADRVEALDGSLTLESAAGAGTTVTVELPLARDQG